MSCSLVSTVSYLGYGIISSAEGQSIFMISIYLAMVTDVIGLTWMFFTKSLSDFVIYSIMVSFSVAICFADFSSAASVQESRGWPMFVVVVDVLLACRLSDRFARILVFVINVWLIILASETGFRFGLYDIPGTISYDDRRTRCDCEKPPCPDIARSIVDFSFYFTIFVCDFLFTRSFAIQVTKEKARVAASVDLAQHLVQNLVNFDLKSSEVLLQSDCNIKDPLHVPFMQLISNLREYRPYLPASLFNSTTSDSSSELDSCNPLSLPRPLSTKPCTVPGRNGQNATIVFTDIQGSTSLWEAAPSGMKLALQIHNKIIREQIYFHRGYEVKTIGDAFMIVFYEVLDGCKFSLGTQYALANASWPTELSNLSSPLRMNETWNGLRVRIGIHTGPVDVEDNPVTGRADYFGPTVNKAARAEGAAVGGVVVVTESVLSLIGSELCDDPSTADVLQALGNPICICEEAVQLRGISDVSNLTFLLPTSLSFRESDIINQLSLRDPQKTSTTATTEIATSSSVTASSPQLAINVVSNNIINDAVPNGLDCSEFVESATLTCIKLSSPSVTSEKLLFEMTRLLSLVLESSDRCSGVVNSVNGMEIVIGFNTSKKCAAHIRDGVRFVGVCYGAFKKLQTKGFCDHRIGTGTCTGPAVYGGIGTNNQRYVVFTGKATEIAKVLAQRARSFDVFSLVTSVQGHVCVNDDPAMRGIIRPVDRFKSDDDLLLSIIYQLRVSSFKADGGIAISTTGSSSNSWGWSGTYTQAFLTDNQEEIVFNADSELSRVQSISRTAPLKLFF